MRVGLIISVIIHVAVFLWIMVARGERPFDPARAEPVLVDLVSPKDAPPLAEPAQEPAKPEIANPGVFTLEPPKAALKTAPVRSAPLKSAPRSAEAPKPEPPKPEPPKPVREADLKPMPKPAPAAPMTAATPSVEDQAAAAIRFAWMLDLPTASLTNAGGGLPSESRSKLTSNEIAKFKARLSHCWVAPDAPASSDFNVVIRVSLKPNGALGGEPEPVLVPALMSGPLLVESAKRALQQCQPYDFLPADKYQDWKVFELGFSVDGPSGDVRIPALDDSSVR